MTTHYKMKADKPVAAKKKPVSNIESSNPIPSKFSIRRCQTKPSPPAYALALAAAEDANTAVYIQEYLRGNLGARTDYVEYLADKFQFMINGGKLKPNMKKQR